MASFRHHAGGCGAGPLREGPAQPQELRHGLYFQGLCEEDLHGDCNSNDHVGPREGVAELLRHQVHRGGPVFELGEDYEDYCG